MKQIITMFQVLRGTGTALQGLMPTGRLARFDKKELSAGKLPLSSLY